MGKSVRIFVLATAIAALLGSAAFAKLGGGESRSKASSEIVQLA